MFFVHTAMEEFWICVRGKLWQRNHVIFVTPLFSKSSFFKMLTPSQPSFEFSRFGAFSSSSVFVTDGLVWTVGFAISRIKDVLSNFSSVVWTGTGGKLRVTLLTRGNKLINCLNIQLTRAVYSISNKSIFTTAVIRSGRIVTHSAVDITIVCSVGTLVSI